MRLFTLLITNGDPAASQPLFERFWPYLLVSPPRYFPAAHVVYTPERERAERLVWEQLERLGRDPGDVGLAFTCFCAPGRPPVCNRRCSVNASDSTASTRPPTCTRGSTQRRAAGSTA